MTTNQPSHHLEFFRLLSFIMLVLSSAISLGQSPAGSMGKLTFRDVFVIPHGTQFQGTQVGGLSSIDYDRETDSYLMICDDRSALHPARYYRAKIAISPEGIDTVMITDKIDLRMKDGRTYPKNSIDPEAMRYDPGSKQTVWLSEGDRRVGNDTILIDPGIFVTDAGKYTGEYPIADNARMTSRAQGPRQNGSFEALSFSDHGEISGWRWKNRYSRTGRGLTLKTANPWFVFISMTL